MRAGAIGAVASGIAVLGFAIFDSGEHASSGPYFVIALMYLAAWALPGFRGRPLLLGLGLLSVVVGVGQINDRIYDFATMANAAGTSRSCSCSAPPRSTDSRGCSTSAATAGWRHR